MVPFLQFYHIFLKGVDHVRNGSWFSDSCYCSRISRFWRRRNYLYPNRPNTFCYLLNLICALFLHAHITPLRLRLFLSRDTVKQKKSRSLLQLRDSNLIPGSIYFSSPLPDKYLRRCRLYFRIRNGNGCYPTAIPTRKFLCQSHALYSTHN